jgi:hypothetical protein
MSLKVMDGRTKKERQDLFIEFYPEFGTISSTAKAAKVDRTVVYMWMKDVEFAKRFSEARKDFVDYLEDIAHNLVKEMGRKKDYKNPTLLMFLLNGNAPEKYKGVTNNNSEARDVLIEFRKISRQAVVITDKAKIEEHTTVEKTIVAYEKEKKTLNEKFGSLKNDNTGD